MLVPSTRSQVSEIRDERSTNFILYKLLFLEIVQGVCNSCSEDKKKKKQTYDGSDGGGGDDDDDGNKEFCILRKPSVSSEETLLENEVQYWKKQNMYLNLVCITELISTSLNSLKNKV